MAHDDTTADPNIDPAMRRFDQQMRALARSVQALEQRVQALEGEKTGDPGGSGDA